MVTAGALNQIETTASVTPTALDSSAVAGASDSTATPAAAAASNVISEPCSCSCLCPMAAFPMAAFQSAANTSQVATPSIVQPSTFQTVASASVVNKVAVSSDIVSSPQASSVSVTTWLNPGTSDSAADTASQPGVLPSIIVTDPGTPTGRAKIQDAPDAPFNINTYQLMTSVGLPVVIDRTVRPTVTVQGNVS